MTVRPAKTPISLGIRPVWSEFSLCAQCVPKTQTFFMGTAKTYAHADLSLCWAHTILLVLSWGGSYEHYKTYRITDRLESTLGALWGSQGSRVSSCGYRRPCQTARMLVWVFAGCSSDSVGIRSPAYILLIRLVYFRLGLTTHSFQPDSLTLSE